MTKVTRKVALATLVALALPMATASAQTITRYGREYNGYANPGGCEIFVHTDGRDEDALHVDCTNSVGATGPARIRYRFLRDVGAEFKPANVDVEVKYNGGQGTAEVRWMVPTPRTVRVIIPQGLYVHIRSITWEQD